MASSKAKRSPFDAKPLGADEYQHLLQEHQNLVLRVSDGTPDGTYRFWVEDGELFWRPLNWVSAGEAELIFLQDALEGDTTTQLLINRSPQANTGQTDDVDEDSSDDQKVRTDGGNKIDGTERWVNDIHQGDATDTLSEMPDSSVHCVVTSPPYFGLRDYGVEGQIGLEKSLDEYITSLIEVATEIRRVLREDGNWWLNIGDSFAGSWRGQWDNDQGQTKEAYSPDQGELPERDVDLRRKSKMLIPHRVAIALQDEGWIVRSDAVWSKPNAMPNPVKDRLNETKEFLFHLTPEPSYWFDLDAVRKSAQQDSIGRQNTGGEITKDSDRYPGRESEDQVHNFDRAVHPNGKNPGDVLEISVSTFPEAHFAVYPEELVETPIKSSCPPKVCAECGAPYERKTNEISPWELEDPARPQLDRALDIFEESDLTERHLQACRAKGFSDAAGGKEQVGAGRNTDEIERLATEAKEVLGGYFREFATAYQEVKRYEQRCECDTDQSKPGIVLDPFAGAGTTCKVAKRLGRRFVGVELNPEYVAMSQRRIGITVDEPERLLDEGETTLIAYTDGSGCQSADEDQTEVR